MNVKDFAQNIREKYDVVDGIIRNPGRFEGECEWVPYYWELALNGEGEDVSDVSGFAARFTVDYEESDAFGLECGAMVEVFQDPQWFVIGTVLA